MKRPVCIHFHIYKNAGTTIDWILKKNFSKNALYLDDFDKLGNIWSIEVVQNFILNHPNIHSLSSHQIRLPLPKSSEFYFIPIILIRNPIDRAFSIYEDQKRIDADTELCKNSKSMNPREFFKWCLDSDYYFVMKNFQTIFLSSRDNHHEAILEDLKLASNNLKHFKILGLVERFDETIVMAEECLRPYFKNIDFSYIKQNINPIRKKRILEERDYDRSIIGDSLFEKLEENNVLDLQLHSFTNKGFDLRIKKIENFNEKLLDFKERCEKYMSLKTLDSYILP